MIIWIRAIGFFALLLLVIDTWPVSLIFILLLLVLIFVARSDAERSQTGQKQQRRIDSRTISSSTPRKPGGNSGRTFMTTIPANTITDAIGSLPVTLLNRSGSVFYSGRGAFEGTRPLYILGLNPGGSPTEQADETVARDLSDWRTLPEAWSAYLDESWQGKPPGTHGLQPRIAHMFGALGLDLRQVPASNVVFARSSSEAMLSAEKGMLLEQCWPVHDAVIRNRRVKAILCLGGTAGGWVRDMLGARQLIDSFIESNARGWRSEAHLSPDGRAVITVTHPGRVDWRNPATDPTPLVQSILDRVG